MFCCCRFRIRCCSCFSQRRRPLLNTGSSSISFRTRSCGAASSVSPPFLREESPSSPFTSSSWKMRAETFRGELLRYCHTALGTYAHRDDALHLDHAVPQSFDLLILHVVLQFHLLQESHTFIRLTKCSGNIDISHRLKLTSRISVSLSM